jgi:tRNA pseudouridine38-40 synthase
LLRRLNGLLGAYSDIVVFSADRVLHEFDARFSALWRRYHYRIADTESVRDPLQRHRTAWHHQVLNTETMQEAAQSLLGLHDFAAYCKSREGATTIRTLQNFRWHRDNDGVLVASLQADAFCHSMVRALVGACVAVGENKLHRGQLLSLRDAGERSNAFMVMPARGLTLIEIGYPPDDQLRSRAEQTRAVRTL